MASATYIRLSRHLPLFQPARPHLLLGTGQLFDVAPPHVLSFLSRTCGPSFAGRCCVDFSARADLFRKWRADALTQFQRCSSRCSPPSFSHAKLHIHKKIEAEVIWPGLSNQLQCHARHTMVIQDVEFLGNCM